MGKKIFAIVVVITLAAAGMIQAAGQSCVPECGRCFEAVEMSCCGMNHEQEHNTSHSTEETPSCCHFEQFPENPTDVARTETVVSIEQYLILSALQTDTIYTVSRTIGIQPLPRPPYKASVPLYLVTCAFLI